MSEEIRSESERDYALRLYRKCSTVNFENSIVEFYYKAASDGFAQNEQMKNKLERICFHFNRINENDKMRIDALEKIILFYWKNGCTPRAVFNPIEIKLIDTTETLIALQKLAEK